MNQDPSPMSTEQERVSEERERKPLPPAYVKRAFEAARRACGSVERRRAWPMSEWGSPVLLMQLCSEIARLQRINADMLAALKELHTLLDFDEPMGRAALFDDDTDINAAMQRARAALSRIRESGTKEK